MIETQPAASDQYDQLLQLMKADAVDYLQGSLELMKMTSWPASTGSRCEIARCTCMLSS